MAASDCPFLQDAVQIRLFQGSVQPAGDRVMGASGFGMDARPFAIVSKNALFTFAANTDLRRWSSWARGFCSPAPPGKRWFSGSANSESL
jgi:hypothetical protein